MNAEIAAKIDQLCDAFERAWKSGTEPDPVSFLSKVSEEMRISLAQQLMLVDADIACELRGDSTLNRFCPRCYCQTFVLIRRTNSSDSSFVITSFPAA